jgi:hypothetical protein
MNFHSENSYIRCLAHIINLICKAILKELKASTHKEAKAILDAMSNSNTESSKIFREVDAQTAIVKLRLLIMWILESTGRIDMFAEFCELRLDYDVDTRWNSCYKMIGLGICVRSALVEFAMATPALHALIITEDEWIFLAELYEVLEPL